MTTLLRQAKAEDYEALCALFAEGDQLHQNALPARFQMTKPARTLEFFQTQLTDEANQFIVAEGAGKIQGFIFFTTATIDGATTMKARTYLYINSMVVAKTSRRQGIGRQLLAYVETWAQAHHITEIELTVFAFNQAALQLYQEVGYTPVSYRLSKDLS